MAEDHYFDKLKEDLSFSGNKEKAAQCLKLFDENSDGALDPEEFHGMCLQLFVKDGKSSSLDKADSRKMFDELDENKDGQIDKEEFNILWKYWLPMILAPKSALLVVDMQNDFIDGSLAVAEAIELVPIINEVLENVKFDHVFYTFDWHPEDHVSFHDNVSLRDLHSTSKVVKEHAKMFDTVVFDGPQPTEQTLWPKHCVQDSKGAELHCDLKVVHNCTNIYKGTCNHIDSYSAFFDNLRLSQTKLTKELCSHRITDIYTCGLAFDICLRHTSIDAARLGFRTVVMEDASKAISDESLKKSRKDMEDAGCIVVSSSQVKSMVTASTRDPRMGLKAAHNVAEARRKAKEKLTKTESSADKKQAAQANGAENVSLLDL